MQEINVNYLSGSANIMRLYHYFVYKNYILIVLEYMNNGDLKQFIKENKKLNPKGNFSEALTAHFIIQILNSLGHLKDINIIHRDIKPENILLDQNYNVKLGDFTLARRIYGNETITTSRSGTLPYLSPECIEERKILTFSESEKLDLFSLGIVMYILLFNKHPFNYKSSLSYEVYLEILTSYRIDFNLEGINISDCCKDFLTGLLEKDYKNRLSFIQAKNHKWILGTKEIVNSKREIFEGNKLITELNNEVITNEYFNSNFNSYEVKYDEKRCNDKNNTNNTSSTCSTNSTNISSNTNKNSKLLKNKRMRTQK